MTARYLNNDIKEMHEKDMLENAKRILKEWAESRSRLDYLQAKVIKDVRNGVKYKTILIDMVEMIALRTNNPLFLKTILKDIEKRED